MRETIARTVVHVDIDFPAESGAAVFGAITDLGHVKVCSVRSNAVKVERTPKLARDELPPSIFLGVQVAGSSLIVQGDREAVLRPGDLAFSDSTTPYTLLDGDGIRQHFFSIPMAALALPYDAIRQLAAVTLEPRAPGGRPCGNLLPAAGVPARHLQGARSRRRRPPEHRTRSRAYYHPPRRFCSCRRTHAEETLLLRILEYARAHLAEPGLNATQIAVAHHISVRHLYNVLARGGISLGDWIRSRRLEECRDELSRPTVTP